MRNNIFIIQYLPFNNKQFENLQLNPIFLRQLTNILQNSTLFIHIYKTVAE